MKLKELRNNYVWKKKELSPNLITFWRRASCRSGCGGEGGEAPTCCWGFLRLVRGEKELWPASIMWERAAPDMGSGSGAVSCLPVWWSRASACGAVSIAIAIAVHPHTGGPRLPRAPWASEAVAPSHTSLPLITGDRKRFGLGQLGKGRSSRARAHQADSQLQEWQGQCGAPHLSHFSALQLAAGIS